MTNRFTPHVLTERTGRADGDNTTPATAVRDEETGLVYAFPLFVDPEVAADVLNQAADAGELGSDPTYFPDGSPDGQDWMPEQEPYTLKGRDEFIDEVYGQALGLLP